MYCVMCINIHIIGICVICICIVTRMYALYVYVLCMWYSMNVHVICLHMCIVYSSMQVLVETKVDIKMSSSIASLCYSLGSILY